MIKFPSKTSSYTSKHKYGVVCNSRTLNRDSKSAFLRVVPVLRCQFERLVDHSVGHSDADAGASRLNLLFTPLQKHLVVPLDALLLLLVGRHEPVGGQRVKCASVFIGTIYT